MQDGHFAAACSASGDLVAMFRVMAMGHEASMRLMGMYEVRDPRQLAWAPPPPGGEPAACGPGEHAGAGQG
jgi:hypothetical protein